MRGAAPEVFASGTEREQTGSIHTPRSIGWTVVRPTSDTQSLSASVDVDVVSVSYQVHLALFRSSSLNDASLIAM